MMGNSIKLDSRRLEGLGLLDTTVYAGRNLAGSIRAKVASTKGMVSADGMFEAYLREEYRVVNAKNVVPFLQVVSLNGNSRRFADGSVSKDGLAVGCSVYGLFDAPNLRNKIIEFLSRKKGVKVATHGLSAMEFWDKQIQKFSEVVKDNIDMQRIREIASLN
jgi:cobyric acid synthase